MVSSIQQRVNVRMLNAGLTASIFAGDLLSSFDTSMIGRHWWKSRSFTKHISQFHVSRQYGVKTPFSTGGGIGRVGSIYMISQVEHDENHKLETYPSWNDSRTIWTGSVERNNRTVKMWGGTVLSQNSPRLFFSSHSYFINKKSCASGRPLK